MTKKLLTLGLIFAGCVAISQVPRKTLFEEFTGENCAPCASTNPALNITLAGNPNVIALKWQVPIPSAPTTTWSLWQTNLTEIQWRYTGSGYGYPSQNTATNTIVSGINSAPSGRFDGQHQWTFGALSDHPFYVSNSVINAAASATTPFSISMNTSWDLTFSNAVVTVTVTAASAFTSSANLVYRLCLIERTINFPTAPGSNGEKDFADVVRKSYPSIQAGTPLPTVWTPGQTQTFTINCAVPSYIQDKGQMAFVGFIQDDGTKKVWQAERTLQPAITNEAKAISVTIPSVTCLQSLTPLATIKNNGVNAITNLTIVPVLDGIVGATVLWAGNLSAGTTTAIPLNLVNYLSGSHTFSFNITGVSGGDVVPSNNTALLPFFNPSTSFIAPVNEGFVNTLFPPTNWMLFNLDGGQNTFIRSTLAGAYGTSGESVLFQVNSAANGDVDDLYLPPTDLSGISAPELSFDFSYCQVATSNKDSIIVFASNDCGTTWTRVYGNGSTSMATAPTNSVSFFVPSASQWSTAVVPFTSYSNAPNLLVKFQVKGNKGNRLFIDNINLQQSLTTGINTTGIENGLTVDVFPNPVTSDATILINTKNSQKIKLSLINALGQTLSIKNYEVQLGANSIKVNCNSYSAGVYFITIEGTNFTKTQKLILSK